MTHVKVVNKKSGVPQIITKQTYNNIKAEMPRLAKDLEFMHECNEVGERSEEVAEAPIADQEKIKEITDKLKADVEKSKKGKKGE